MNREEVNEALKLIKEPITVNCIEYKYFDQENYEKLLRVYENCRWFVDNYEQVLQNIENLQQEIQRKDNIINELKNTLETCIYGIETKGCSVNYNCEYDSEEDYICAIQEQSRLNTYKFVLDKIKELEGDNK